MNIELIDNFRFKVIGSSKILLVESDRIDETKEFIKRKKIRNIELSYFQGYKIKEISFILEVADIIEAITVVDDSINLKEIGVVKNLKKIFIGGENKSPIDFSCFKSLESCNIFWHKGLTGLSSCKDLDELVLRKYTYADKTSSFISLPSIKKLILIQSKFVDLTLLNNLPQLKELEISYNKYLQNISDLRSRKTTLIKLRLEHCKGILDYSPIKDLEKLEYLAISSCADIPSLKFIKDLNKLQHLSFVGTKVIDGDLSYCKGIGHVGFDNRKHYSHTYEELKGET